jgi:hypothetical protein
MATQKQRGRTTNKPGKNAHLRELCYYCLRPKLKDGSIIRPNLCSQCDKKCIPEPHHEDYAKPYEIEWLCDECHRKRHVIFRNGSMLRRLYEEYNE